MSLAKIHGHGSAVVQIAERGFGVLRAGFEHGARKRLKLGQRPRAARWRWERVVDQTDRVTVVALESPTNMVQPTHMHSRREQPEQRQRRVLGRCGRSCSEWSEAPSTRSAHSGALPNWSRVQREMAAPAARSRDKAWACPPVPWSIRPDSCAGMLRQPRFSPAPRASAAVRTEARRAAPVSSVFRR